MAEYFETDRGEHLERCPNCRYVDTLDNFDVGGADEGMLFCTQCHYEHEMETVLMSDAEDIEKWRAMVTREIAEGRRVVVDDREARMKARAYTVNFPKGGA